MNTLENFHKKAFNIITISGFLTIIFFLWLQFTGRTNTEFNNYVAALSGAVFLISSIICFVYYKKIGDRGGISLTILNTGIANLLFAIGSFIWSYYNIFDNIELPYPSSADIVFIFMPLAYAIAVGSLLQMYRSSTKLSTLLVAILVFITLVLSMFFFVGKPEISGELPFWENFFNIVYALSDSIYVGAGVSLLIIAGGKMYKGIFVWVLAMFLITISDIVFSYRSATEIIWNGDIADQLYTLSAIVFTYAIIYLAKMPERKEIEI